MTGDEIDDKYIKALMDGGAVERVLTSTLNPWKPTFPFPTDLRKIILRPLNASLFGWIVYPDEYHITGKMNYEFSDEEWDACMVVDKVKLCRAPIPHRLAWLFIGVRVWQLQQWRAA